jgi:hypothetical protein
MVLAVAKGPVPTLGGCPFGRSVLVPVTARPWHPVAIAVDVIPAVALKLLPLGLRA